MARKALWGLMTLLALLISAYALALVFLPAATAITWLCWVTNLLIAEWMVLRGSRPPRGETWIDSLLTRAGTQLFRLRSPP